MKKIMKKCFKPLALMMLGLWAIQANAQETVTPFHSSTRKAPVKREVAEARFLPFFDDFSHSTLYPDSTKWTDNSALVNDGFPLCPPNRNGVTLDVLDANGCVYDFAISNAFVAEYLTSVRIRLDSIMEPEPRALTPADSVYFSFYYQPQGNGNPPESQDSLVLQFGTTTQHQEFLFLDYQDYNIADILAEMHIDTLFPGDTVWASVGCQEGLFTTVTDTLTSEDQGSIAVPCDSVFTTVTDTTWYHIWSVPGMTLDTFMIENNGQYFKQVMIPIKDMKYFRNDFYFRFYNYASIVNSSLPANRSNEDNWNIDFVYLNINRSVYDTDYPMLSFSGKRPSFFNRYQSIPYRQYRLNPNSAMNESLEIDIANLDGIDHEAHYYYSVTMKHIIITRFGKWGAVSTIHALWTLSPYNPTEHMAICNAPNTASRQLVPMSVSCLRWAMRMIVSSSLVQERSSKAFCSNRRSTFFCLKVRMDCSRSVRRWLSMVGTVMFFLSNHSGLML